PQNTIVLGAVDVRTETASSRQKLAWVARAMLSGLTFASVKLRVVNDSEVRAAVERAGPFDGYVLNSVQFAGAFERL
ncbi:MAG: glycosyl transferase, partial [Mesorhizobium sp.]